MVQFSFDLFLVGKVTLKFANQCINDVLNGLLAEVPLFIGFSNFYSVQSSMVHESVAFYIDDYILYIKVRDGKPTISDVATGVQLFFASLLDV